jgi:large subunit ribosomal protein L1
MAKKKADLIEEAKALGLEVSEKMTIAQINEAIAGASEVPKAEAEVEVKEEVAEEKFAKSGKRSKKHAEEVLAKEEKEARKAAGDTSSQGENEAIVAKGPKPITRPRIERRGKKYQAAAAKVEKDKVYALNDALKLATETNPAKFDASVEVHVRLGVDPRQADQNIRTTVVLPNGTGKDVKVAVFAPEADHKAAKEAGANIVGDEEFLKQLDKEILDFDVLIATPAYMPKLGKYARLLGPRGLMPNPKAGTVAADVAKAVSEAKAGKVEYRVDKQAIVHLSIGKVSFGEAKLAENAKAFFDSLAAQKPSNLKGAYVKSVSIATSQGPSVKAENPIA